MWQDVLHSIPNGVDPCGRHWVLDLVAAEFSWYWLGVVTGSLLGGLRNWLLLLALANEAKSIRFPSIFSQL